MQYHKEKVRNKNTIGALSTIPVVFLNAMRLHIKMLQLSNQGQASGKMIKNKLDASEVGNQYEGFGINWAWRPIRELWPKEITPT